MFLFQDLIERYGVNFMIEFPEPQQNDSGNDLDDYDLDGNLIKSGSVAAVQMFGALIPLSKSEIYQSGGRLTSADRTLYSTNHDIPAKSKIFYEGFVYQVTEKLPLKDFADFSRYTLKGVDAFG